jgi:tetratricopeptide (TPR) repeat protein
VADLRYVLSQMPVEVRSAGEVLKREARPGARVMSRKGHIGYYSGLATVAFPRVAGVPELAAHARAAGVEYIYFSWYEAELRPEFWALLDTAETLPGLAVVHATEHNPSVLYRIGPEFGRVPEWFANDTLRNVPAARAQLRALDPRHTVWAGQVLGHDAVDGRRYAEAVDHFRELVRLQPAEPVAWLALGDAAMKLGELPVAEDALRRALELAPDDRAARARLGAVEAQTGQLQRAAETWRPLIAEVRDPRVLQQMLPVYEAIGDHATAAALRSAITGRGASP